MPQGIECEVRISLGVRNPLGYFRRGNNHLFVVIIPQGTRRKVIILFSKWQSLRVLNESEGIIFLVVIITRITKWEAIILSTLSLIRKRNRNFTLFPWSFRDFKF